MNTDATTPRPPSPSAAASSPTQSPAVIDPSKLPNDIDVLKQMIVELLTGARRDRRAIAELQERLDALLRRGRPTEPIDPNQPLLFPELAQPEPAAPTPPAVETESNQPRKSKPHGRRRPARQLRREQRRYELPTLERLCPECGTMRGEIGVQTTEQYDYKPAEVFVVEHQRVKYACKCCEGHVAIAPKPPQPLDKALPGPGLLAQIIVDKYQDHIPLHRTEQRFERLGVKLPRSTMCDWMASCAVLLTPLWQVLKHWVLQSKVLHTDDTTVPVRDETKNNHRYGRLWDYIGDQDHPGIVFDYTITHARDGPAEFLKTSKAFCKPMPTAATTASTPAPTARSLKSTKHKAIVNKGLVQNGQDGVLSGQAVVISTAALLALVQWLRSRLGHAKGESPCSSRTSSFPPVHSKGRKTGRQAHAAAGPASAAIAGRDAAPAGTGATADDRSAAHSSRKPKGGKP